METLEKKNVDIELGTIMACGALVGTEFGVRILNVFSNLGKMVINGRTVDTLDIALNLLFLLLMISVVIISFRERTNQGDEVVLSPISVKLRSYKIPPLLSFKRAGIDDFSIWVPLLISTFVGIMTGLMGVGGGFVNFPILLYVIGVPTTIAVGTSAFQILFASGYGAFRHVIENNVSLVLLGFLICGSFIGVQFGVKVSSILHQGKIRKYFAFIILIGIAIVIFDMYAKLFKI